MEILPIGWNVAIEVPFYASYFKVTVEVAVGFIFLGHSVTTLFVIKNMPGVVFSLTKLNTMDKYCLHDINPWRLTHCQTDIYS